MPQEKRKTGLSPLLLAAAGGTIGVWLWWRNRPPLPKSNEMAGRVCVVTGGTAGIGKATATALARQGAHVIIACRSPTKGDATCDYIRRKVPGAAVQAMPLDLESTSSIRGFVKHFRESHLPLHVLVNNAAILVGKTEMIRGMEKTAVVNHLGPFLLTNLLLPELQKSAAAPESRGATRPANAPGDDQEVPASRIVNVASRLEKRGELLVMNDPALPPGPAWFQPAPGAHDGFKTYRTSKLCNMLFTFELDRRLANAERDSRGKRRVTVNAVTPGLVNTGLADTTVSPWLKWFAALAKPLLMRTVEKGAETVVWAASSPTVESFSGKFFGDLEEAPFSETAKDVELGETLWKASEVAAGLEESERIV